MVSVSRQFRPLTFRNVDFRGSWDLLGSPGGGSGDPLGSSWGTPEAPLGHPWGPKRLQGPLGSILRSSLWSPKVPNVYFYDVKLMFFMKICFSSTRELNIGAWRSSRSLRKLSLGYPESPKERKDSKMAMSRIRLPFHEKCTFWTPWTPLGPPKDIIGGSKKGSQNQSDFF